IGPNRKSAIQNLANRLSFFSGHAQDLSQRRYAATDFVPAILPEQLHSVLHRQVSNCTRVRALDDDLANLRSRREKLENADTSPISRTAARLAARRLPYGLGNISVPWFQLGFVGLKSRERYFLPAARAKPTNESLRQYAQER